ncbi:MAG: hypothetical protein Q4D38_13965 [Planctomycetia bacterium]|nr:hypothetical protein [Planctomycetia bacterium]
MNRAKYAGEILERILSENVPEAQVLRTYTPTMDLKNLETGVPAVFITLEDISTEGKNSNGSKFVDLITFTLAVVEKLPSVGNSTDEVDGLIEVVQKIRDILRYRVLTVSGARVLVTTAEHASSRPVYDRELLAEGVFAGLLFVETRVNGEKEEAV